MTARTWNELLAQRDKMRERKAISDRPRFPVQIEQPQIGSYARAGHGSAIATDFHERDSYALSGYDANGFIAPAPDPDRVLGRTRTDTGRRFALQGDRAQVRALKPDGLRYIGDEVRRWDRGLGCWILA